MSEEEHPCTDIPATSEPEPEAVSAESQIICTMVNSRERASIEGTPISEYRESFHPVRHKNELSEADMEAYFKLSDDLDLFHSHERELLQEYYRDKQANGSLLYKFCDTLNQYEEAWLKFNVNLVGKGNAITAIRQIGEAIPDLKLREKFEDEFRALLERQKMMDFAREKLCRHFHEIQLDELIAQIRSGMSMEAIQHLVVAMEETQRLHTERLDQVHEFSKAAIVLQEEIKNILPSGGIRFLREQAEVLSREKLLVVVNVLTHSGISEDMWKLFWMNQEGKNNYEIANIIGKDQSTVYRRMEDLKSRLRAIGFENLLKKYGTTKKQAEDDLCKSGTGHYSREVANREEKEYSEE